MHYMEKQCVEQILFFINFDHMCLYKRFSFSNFLQEIVDNTGKKTWNLGLNLGSISMDSASKSCVTLEKAQSLLSFNLFNYKRGLITLTS